MAKKTHQEKEAARMREVLRAQSANRPSPPPPAEDGSDPEGEGKEESSERGATPRVSPRHIRSDLIRSGILTAAALAVISLLYLLL